MIFAIKPFEIHDGDGIRTTVFFKGCPLRCRWCHNPESFSPKQEMLFDPTACIHCLQCTNLCSANTSQNGRHLFVRENCTLCGDCLNVCSSQAFELTGEEKTAREIAELVLKDEIFMKGSGGGVTFSGGEPLMQADFCAELAKILKAHNIHIAIDTSGYASRKAIDTIIPYTDTFLFDLKAIDEDVHIACTGVSNQPILENILYVDSLGIPMEIRYPYVPTMNDGQAEKIAAFVSGLRHVKMLRLLPYHNYAQQKYICLGMSDKFSDFPIPSKTQLQSVLNLIKNHGVLNASCF